MGWEDPMKNRKTVFIIVSLLVLTLILIFLTAASPNKTRLRILNQTGEEIFLVLTDKETGLIAYNLRIPGEPMPDPTQTPTAGPKPTKDPSATPTILPTAFNIDRFKEENTTMFTMERKSYYARLVACGVVMDGDINLTTNLHLNITPCYDMLNYDAPKYLGEPTFEKPNWFRTTGMANWRFRYFLPDIDMQNYPEPTGPNSGE
jgi:hypothetical protein